MFVANSDLKGLLLSRHHELDHLLQLLGHGRHLLEVLLRQLAVRETVQIHLLLAVAVGEHQNLGVSGDTNWDLVCHYSIHGVFALALLHVQDLTDQVNARLWVTRGSEKHIANRFAMKDEIVANNLVEEGVGKVGHHLLPGEEDGEQILEFDELDRCYPMSTSP